MRNIAGMVRTRDEASRRDSQLLPEKALHAVEFKSFGASPEQNPDFCENLEVLRSDAALAMVSLTNSVCSYLKEINVSPDDHPVVDGKRISNDFPYNIDNVFKNFTLGPLKTAESCTRKVEDDYQGEFRKLCDVARCTVVASTERNAVEFLRGLLQGKIEGISVVRLKNRFKNFLFTGVRDCLINVSVSILRPGEPSIKVSHISEIQLHFGPILALKAEMHIYYEFFRDYFRGSNDSYAKRTEIFDRLKGRDADSASLSGGELVTNVLESKDVSRLRALESLMDRQFLGDYQILAICREKLLQLAKASRDTSSAELRRLTFRFGEASLFGGEYDRAEVTLRDVLEETKNANDAALERSILTCLAQLLSTRADHRDAFAEVSGDSGVDRTEAAEIFDAVLATTKAQAGEGGLATLEVTESYVRLLWGGRPVENPPPATWAETFQAIMAMASFGMGVCAVYALIGFMIYYIVKLAIGDITWVDFGKFYGISYGVGVAVVLLFFSLHHCIRTKLEKTESGRVLLGEGAAQRAEMLLSYAKEKQIFGMLERVLEERKKQLPENDPSIAAAQCFLGEILAELENAPYDTFRGIFSRRGKLVDVLEETRTDAADVAELDLIQNEIKAAKRLLSVGGREFIKSAVDSYEKTLGRNHSDTVDANGVLSRKGDVTSLKKGLELIQDQLGEHHKNTIKAAQRLKIANNMAVIAKRKANLFVVILLLIVMLVNGGFAYWMCMSELDRGGLGGTYPEGTFASDFLVIVAPITLFVKLGFSMNGPGLFSIGMAIFIAIYYPLIMRLVKFLLRRESKVAIVTCGAAVALCNIGFLVWLVMSENEWGGVGGSYPGADGSVSGNMLAAFLGIAFVPITLPVWGYYLSKEGFFIIGSFILILIWKSRRDRLKAEARDAAMTEEERNKPKAKSPEELQREQRQREEEQRCGAQADEFYV
jgi:hypothetical protein